MTFENMKIKEIKFAIRYVPEQRHWVAKDRNTHIIGFNLSGRELHDFGYQKFVTEENCIFFFNQRDDFSVNVYEKGLSYSVHFTTYEPVETDTFCIKTDNVGAFYPLLEKIERQASTSLGGAHLAAASFYRLCAEFDAIRRRSYTKTDPRMLLAREYIEQHFREPDCLEQTYRTAKISRRHFDELFKLHFHQTPSRYITLQKLEYAKQLLATPHLSVMEISELCGFSDVYYFSKVFKAQTNQTPSAYRKECGQE